MRWCVIIALAATSCRQLPNVAPEAPFELRVFPSIAPEGSDVRLTCHVPESLGRGVIRLALEDVAISGPRVIEHAQNTLLVARVECGTWKATCLVESEGGRRYAEHMLEVRGMCDGRDDRPARR